MVKIKEQKNTGWTVSPKKYGIAVFFKHEGNYIHYGNRYFDCLKRLMQSFIDCKIK